MREDFPFFAQHPDLAYLDNSATTQKPRVVLDAVHQTLMHAANPGRGTYRLAAMTSRAVEDSRAAVAALLHAEPSDVAFTSGTTSAMALVAQAWNLQPDDEVVVGRFDHASTVGPWHASNGHVRTCGVTVSGDTDEQELFEQVNERTRVVVLTHVHNVFGQRSSIADIAAKLPPDVAVIVDAAQSIGHFNVDVRTLGADVVMFSGHKMFAPSGTGALWVCPEHHERFAELARWHHSATTGVAQWVEVGTVNTAGIAGLGAAARYVQSVGLDEIARNVRALTHLATDALVTEKRVQLLPGVHACSSGNGFGIVSFRIEGIDSADVGFVLDDEGVCVRTGSHCITNDTLAANSIRISMHGYNTASEVLRATKAIAAIAASA